MEQKANINSKVEVLSEMRELAFKGRDAVLQGEFDALGEMLHRGWELKKQMASKVTNSTIDDIYETARRAGALGGKVTGAGGGGFILLYCPRGKQGDVARALWGLREMPFRFEQDGSKVIFNCRRAW